MIKFFHRLLNPHCDHCIEEARESKICPTCEVYRSQLELANHEKKLLLETIEKINNPIIEEKEFPHTEPIQSRTTPWPIQRKILEREDRIAAKLTRDKEAELKSKKIEELEKEVGIG